MTKINSGIDTKALLLIINEQQRDHDYLLKIYERAGAKENVLLAASFGILAYLYSTPASTDTLMQRPSVPAESYGMVIYLLAAAALIFGILKLMLSVFGNNVWEIPYETSKSNYDKDFAKNLVYFKERYDAAEKTNLDSYEKRKFNLRLCFYIILISAIILVSIKTLQ